MVKIKNEKKLEIIQAFLMCGIYYIFKNIYFLKMLEIIVQTKTNRNIKMKK